MTIRNGKMVYTTSLPPTVLEEFRQYCWNNKLKMNGVLENLLNDFLKNKKISA